MDTSKAQLADWASLIEQLTQSNGGKYIDDISLLTTDEARIRFCFNDVEILNAVDSWKTKSERFLSAFIEKSKVISEECRLQGHKLFAEKRYLEAVDSYTKALLYSPTANDSESCQNLTLNYSNRSAASFYLKKYWACLADIEQAIELACSIDLKFKLYARKAKCWYQLGDFEKCHEVVKTALSIIQNRDLISNTSYVNRTERELKDLITNAAEKLPCNFKDSKELELLPNVSFGTNSSIDSVSAAVDLKYNSSRGRYLVANRNIKTGDVLFVEKPFASVLLPKFNETHCHHCHRIIETAIPCKLCSQVRYCSSECSRSSFQEYHGIECRWMPILYRTGILHLAMRIVSKAGISNLLQNRIELESTEFPNMFNTSNEPSLGPYFNVYSLVTNSHCVKPKDMFCYSVSATLLTMLLDKEILNCSTDTDARYFIGSIILRSIQQLIGNAYAITKLNKESPNNDSELETEVQERIATAVYPSVSLMNHSCDPNIISSYKGDVLIVRAARDIQTNEEVYNCYGPHYLRMSNKERKEALEQQYYFKCDCCRCSEDGDKFSMHKAFKCKACNGPVLKNQKCSDCGSELKDYSAFLLKYQQSLKSSDDAKLLFEHNKNQKAMKDINECLKVQKTILYKFHPHLLFSMDLAARICAELEMYDKCADILRQTLQATEEIYGSQSIELANELQKFTDVMGNDISKSQIQSKNDVYLLKSKCKETLSHLEKGLTIFETLYGPGHESFKEMADKHKHLSEVESGIQTIAQKM